MLGGTWVIPHGFGSLNDDLVCVGAERFDGRGDELVSRKCLSRHQSTRSHTATSPKESVRTVAHG
jgi:hypothetical protein